MAKAISCVAGKASLEVATVVGQLLVGLDRNSGHGCWKWLLGCWRGKGSWGWVTVGYV